MSRLSNRQRGPLVLACVGIAACGANVASQGTEGTGGKAGATSAPATPAPVASGAARGLADLGSGIQPYVPHYIVRATTPEEAAADAKLKPEGVAAATPTVLSPTAETLLWAAAKAPDDLVNLTLVLPEVPFAWDGFRIAKGADRQALVMQREDDLAGIQQPLLDKLAALKLVGRPQWLANLIHVTAPARLAETLASWPEIVALQHDLPIQIQGTSGDGYYGADRRGAIQAQRLLNEGFTGNQGDGASSTSPVRLGDVGQYTDNSGALNLIPNYHPGFKSGVFTRYYSDQTCAATSQTCVAAGNPTKQTHDTVVMGVMAGGITAGQDPKFPGTNTAAQIDRSGIAPGAQIEYYQTGANTTQASAFAFQAAVAKGVDVLNNSWNAGTPGSPNQDSSGLNEVIQNAFNAGVFIVFSAGDSNGNPFSNSCNQGYPSNRPEVLAVNGTNTTYTSTGKVQSNPTLLSGSWATSGCTANVYNGSSFVAQSNNSIGVDAPGEVGLSYFWNSSTNFGYSGNWIGSSFSAPITAGAAGLLQDAWFADGSFETNYFLKTDLMMLTDGYNFTSYTDGGKGRNSGGISPFSGAGRLQLHSPDNGSFTSGWAWGGGHQNIGPGQTISETIPANLQHYRVGLFWEETDLTQVADIDLHIDALDSTGAVCQGSFANQSDFSINNSIHINRSDIPACALPSGSLQFRIVTYAMPAGQTRTVTWSELQDNETGF